MHRTAPTLTTPPRRALAGLLAVAVALLAAVAAAPAAHADGEGGGEGDGDVFRYWSYFHVEGGEYVTAQEGLASANPADGSVEALRYAAPADFNDPNLPRADLGEVDFQAVCADTRAAAGEKRVAVILDYGVEADASDGAEVPEPAAACASVPQSANALQTVQDVADVRTESSSFGPQLCGIDGYPATGCSGAARSATPPGDGTVEFAIAGQGADAENAQASSAETTETGDDGGNAVRYVLLGLVALALLAGGLVLARRRA